MRDFLHRDLTPFEHLLFIALLLLLAGGLGHGVVAVAVTVLLLFLGACGVTCYGVLFVTTRAAEFAVRQVRRVTGSRPSADAEMVPAAAPKGRGDELTPPCGL
jgi:hypothetical protein